MRETKFVIGNYGNFNMGDETILKGLFLELVKEYGDVSLVVPTRNPGFEGTYHGELAGRVSSFHVYDLRALLGNLRRSNEVIIGGGGIWSGYTGPLAKLIPVFALLSKVALRRVTFRGIGMYRTAPAVERFLVNLAASVSDGVTVRDVESYESLWTFVRKRARLVDDYAIRYLRHLDRNAFEHEHLLEGWSQYQLIEETVSSRFVVGISLKPTRNGPFNDMVVEVMSKFMNRVNSEHSGEVLWLLFPFAETESRVEDDRSILEAVRKRLEDRNSALLVEQTNPILWYLLVKRQVNYFVGMRYHSLVFSWVAGKPFFGIAYENKNINLFNQLGHGEWATPDRLTPSLLLDSFERHFR